jgi:hypothetical protein
MGLSKILILTFFVNFTNIKCIFVVEEKNHTAGVKSFNPSTEGRHRYPAKPTGSLKHYFKSTLDAFEIDHISIENT